MIIGPLPGLWNYGFHAVDEIIYIIICVFSRDANVLRLVDSIQRAQRRGPRASHKQLEAAEKPAYVVLVVLPCQTSAQRVRTIKQTNSEEAESMKPKARIALLLERARSPCRYQAANFS